MPVNQGSVSKAAYSLWFRPNSISRFSVKTPVPPAAPSFWHRYKAGLVIPVIPAAYLLRDATITIIAISTNWAAK
jgi:hypothetical protein